MSGKLTAADLKANHVYPPEARVADFYCRLLKRTEFEEIMREVAPFKPQRKACMLAAAAVAKNSQRRSKVKIYSRIGTHPQYRFMVGSFWNKYQYLL